MQYIMYYHLDQGLAIYGQPRHFTRLATFCCHPSRDLLLSTGPRPFSFFNDGFVAINRRNDSHLLTKTFFVVFATELFENRSQFLAKTFFLFFLSLPSIWRKKSQNFWRRPFFLGPLEWWHPAGTLL